MAEDGWITGADVLALLDQARDGAVARADLENAFELGKARGRYASRKIVRKAGGAQPQDGGLITPKLWARIRSTYKDDDVWKKLQIDLPATEKEAATQLVAVKFEEIPIRTVLAHHGLPAPVDKVRKPRSGGHNMSAHGAVITETVIALLKLPLHELVAVKEKELAADLLDRFVRFDKKREQMSEENRIRMARQILAKIVSDKQRVLAVPDHPEPSS